MSLDVYLVDNSKDEYSRYLYSRNITHNLNTMADAAGIYEYLWHPDEIKIKKASELVEPLTDGLYRLRKLADHFRKYNPKNGWGSYEGLVAFVEEYLQACKDNPEANVEVSR